MFSLPFKVEEHDGFDVLRDDLIIGGTKRRALYILCKNLPHTKFVYAGTLMGHGALALAHAARDAGKEAHIYIASNDEDHFMIERLKNAGAHVHLHSPMPISTLFSAVEKQHLQDKTSFIFPPGFASSDFEDAMVSALSKFDASSYSEIWTCGVSGTFAKALSHAFPNTDLKIVHVVKNHAALDFAEASYHATEKYHQEAKLKPPYPSCVYTDAKIWSFVKEHAQPNALVWNIAGLAQ